MQTTGGTAARALLLGTVAALGTACASTHATGASHSPAPRTARPVVSDAEMTVVAYGSVRRRDLTSAVSSVRVRRQDAINQWHAVDLLDGRVAGVDVTRLPGGERSVRVRGGTSDPLYIVDGIPYARGASQRSLLTLLNPADIARIDVLKDAGATSAYGSRGANGVVFITTRRGR